MFSHSAAGPPRCHQNAASALATSSGTRAGAGAQPPSGVIFGALEVVVAARRGARPFKPGCLSVLPVKLFRITCFCAGAWRSAAPLRLR